MVLGPGMKYENPTVETRYVIMRKLYGIKFYLNEHEIILPYNMKWQDCSGVQVDDDICGVNLDPVV